MTYDPIASRRAELERQIASAQRALDTIQMVPTEDTYSDGAVIRAEIRVGSADAHTYVFLKIVQQPEFSNDYKPVAHWYHTGFIPHNVNSRRRKDDPFFTSWHEFQSWLIDRGRVIESWEVLEQRCKLDHSTEPCTLKHLTFPRAHEDVRADILDVLRFEYGSGEDFELKHLRVINKIMRIEGVYR